MGLMPMCLIPDLICNETQDCSLDAKLGIFHMFPGTGQLKEWLPLQSDSISMPTVRVAHPTTTMRFFDGTRRKRKAAVMEYSWSVGDRVDAWLQDW